MSSGLQDIGHDFYCGWDGSIHCKILEDEAGVYNVFCWDSVAKHWWNAVDGRPGQGIDELVLLAKKWLHGSDAVRPVLD